MPEATELETTTHWQRTFFRSIESRRDFEEKESDDKPLMRQVPSASDRLTVPGTHPFLDKISEPRQTPRNERLLAGIKRWGSVYDPMETPTDKIHGTYVETPSEDWLFCADPAVMPRVPLKKRMSILNVFG
jgi:hypothetical protein